MSPIEFQYTNIAEMYYIKRVIQKQIHDDIDKGKLLEYREYTKVNNITILYVNRIGNSKAFYIRFVKSDNIDDSYYFEPELANEINSLPNDAWTNEIETDIYFFQYNDLSFDNIQYDVYNLAKKRPEDDDEEIERQADYNSDSSTSNSSKSEQEDDDHKRYAERRAKYKTESLKDNKYYYDRQVKEKKYPEVIPEEITNYKTMNHMTVIRIRKIESNNYEVIIVKGDRVRDFLNLRNDIADELSKEIYNNSTITLTLDTEFLKYNYIKLVKEFDYDFSQAKQAYNDKHINEHNEAMKIQYERNKDSQSYRHVGKPRYRKHCVQCNIEQSLPDRTYCSKCKYKNKPDAKIKCQFCDTLVENNVMSMFNHYKKEHIENKKEDNLCKVCKINEKMYQRTICKECSYKENSMKISCKYCDELVSRKHMNRHIQRKHPEKV